ncbi:hypothetical protein [Dactylosporangium sp. CA-139066]|uniref:hypothetical protein n=1 Tax=Dactylosporangium sp. CA-139066 TaxID=3239930 RepID=UPI003D902949
MGVTAPRRRLVQVLTTAAAVAVPALALAGLRRRHGRGIRVVFGAVARVDLYRGAAGGHVDRAAPAPPRRPVMAAVAPEPRSAIRGSPPD